MKVTAQLTRIWSAAVGFLFTLGGLVQPGSTALPPEGTRDLGTEPKNRAARPEPERLKAHEIAFEDAAGAKNRGAVAQEPDGRFRGVIAQSDGRTKGVIEEPAAKDKTPIPQTQPDPGREKGQTMPPLPPKVLVDHEWIPPKTKTPIPQTQPDPQDKFFDVFLPPPGDKATTPTPPTPSTKERELHQAAPQDKAFVFDSTQPKDKAIIIESPGRANEHFIPPPPPKDTAFEKSAPAKKEAIIGDPGQEKGHFIPPPPPKDTAFEKSEPGKKDKAIWMADPSGTDKGRMVGPAPAEKGRTVPPPPQQQPGPPSKDHRCDHFTSPPSRDEAIDEQLINPPAPQAPAPGPQSLRPGIDYSLLLTQEQKDHVVMGIRDRLWTLNAEGKLERRLAGGVRAVMQEGGWVEVYSAEGHLLSAYQDVRAERIDLATRITERMKQRILVKKG